MNKKQLIKEFKNQEIYRNKMIINYQEISKIFNENILKEKISDNSIVMVSDIQNPHWYNDNENTVTISRYSECNKRAFDFTSDFSIAILEV